jgi:hypothetical protein
MRTATAIALLAAGAILTFAVSARVPGVNLRLAGVIIILAGLAALLAPPSPAADWLRRRRGHPDPAGLFPAPQALGEPGEDAYPAYLLQDPAVLAAEVLNGIRNEDWPQPAGPASGPRTPRASAEPGIRAAGSRPLHSVDLSDGADPGRRNELG